VRRTLTALTCSQPQGRSPPVAAAAGRALWGTGFGDAFPATTAAPSGASSGGGRAYGSGPTSSGASTTASGTAAAGDNFAFSRRP
jgi:hypothetical protein